MSGNNKREYGDYQTPVYFCDKICNYLSVNYKFNPDIIIEPTCGIGNFITTVSKYYHAPVVGIEINSVYAQCASSNNPYAQIVNANVFDYNFKDVCEGKQVLFIGNPPWATNSSLDINTPYKSNFKGLKGIDALTGMSNFDICEYIILDTLGQVIWTNSILCFICKTSVARNVISEIFRRQIPVKNIEMLKIDSKAVFGVSVAACGLIIHLSENSCDTISDVYIKNFETGTISDTLSIINGQIRFNNYKEVHDLSGSFPYPWRSGIKHDCSKIIELHMVDRQFVNKDKEVLDVEDDIIYPLVKSSDFKSPIICEFSKFVIVTQRSTSQPTRYIADYYPKMWNYLNAHKDNFCRRKSSIYKKGDDFSIFGVGDYSFAPYKVGISGFYKKPLFGLLYSTKPVMLDDTCYSISFYDYDTAYCMMLLLNSRTVQEYLISIAFLDSKRPYTSKLLSKLDLRKCTDAVLYSELKGTESLLNLPSHITKSIYSKFIDNFRQLFNWD